MPVNSAVKREVAGEVEMTSEGRGFIGGGGGSTDRTDCKQMELKEKMRMGGIQGKQSQRSINI